MFYRPGTHLGYLDFELGDENGDPISNDVIGHSANTGSVAEGLLGYGCYWTAEYKGQYVSMLTEEELARAKTLLIVHYEGLTELDPDHAFPFPVKIFSKKYKPNAPGAHNAPRVCDIMTGIHGTAQSGAALKPTGRESVKRERGIHMNAYTSRILEGLKQRNANESEFCRRPRKFWKAFPPCLTSIPSTKRPVCWSGSWSRSGSFFSAFRGWTIRARCR